MLSGRNLPDTPLPDSQVRALTELMPQLVWTATPEGEVDWCNQR
jgi:hypothetical protein